MSENFHQSGAYSGDSMNPLDTAKAWERLLQLKTGKDIKAALMSFEDKYGLIQEIAEEIGVSKVTIIDYLKLLSQPELIQKDIEAGRPRKEN